MKYELQAIFGETYAGLLERLPDSGRGRRAATYSSRTVTFPRLRPLTGRHSPRLTATVHLRGDTSRHGCLGPYMVEVQRRDTRQHEACLVPSAGGPCQPKDFAIRAAIT